MRIILAGQKSIPNPNNPYACYGKFQQRQQQDDGKDGNNYRYPIETSKYINDKTTALGMA